MSKTVLEIRSEGKTFDQPTITIKAEKINRFTEERLILAIAAVVAAETKTHVHIRNGPCISPP